MHHLNTKACAGLGRMWLLLVLSLVIYGLSLHGAVAQTMLTGQALDAETGDSIPMVSVVYHQHHVGVASDVNGRFSIRRHNGWTLKFSAVGYEVLSVTVSAATKSPLVVRLKPEAQQLESVTVTADRQKYSRKNNPAVELMKRVVERKRLSDLANRDYYRYNKYQKITFALNDITPSTFDEPFFQNKPWIKDHTEVCAYNQKLILPLTVDETASQHIYRKEPHTERNIIMGQKSTGINDLFQTGDILTTVLKEVFTDVNIYDDQVRLLQYPFTSPIGKNAVSFYRFYIEDTLRVDRDSCIHLSFLPNNPQDFGFRGDIYVLKDSSYQVKRCELSLPRQSGVNFVDNMKVVQEFDRLPDGSWVLSVDDMLVELSLFDFLQKAAVIRTTRLSDYDFSELPNSMFRGSQKDIRDADAMMRGDDFWNQYRQVRLTKSEDAMDTFVDNIQQVGGFKYIMIGLKALMENFVETGNPSKVDIGPVNTIISNNFIDGFRTRLSAQTTANLSRHWFLSGYYAHGWKSRKNYYKAELTYSFNEKEYMPSEFTKRTLTFLSNYDVMSPSDKFISTDKDNVFTALKWANVHKMMFYNRQQLTFEYEQDFGLKTTVALKAEQNEAAGELTFTPLSTLNPSPSPLHLPPSTINLRTTELRFELEYCPGATYINTKQRRTKVNNDAPIFTVGHTLGLKGFLGGDYRYNYTEASVYKRFWLNSWGKLDFYVRGGVQWNTVPFPLLCMPEANLSYIIQKNTFDLMNNMEFLNDRFVSAHVSWDINGKLFNRIPLLKKLKWREYVAVKMLWGGLSDKNNPTLAQNADSNILMLFPEGSYVMDTHRPYWEIIAGVHNIFRILHVEFVHRMNYNDLPTAHKNGVRLKLSMTF